MNDGLNNQAFGDSLSRLQESWQALENIVNTSESLWDDDARRVFENEHWNNFSKTLSSVFKSVEALSATLDQVNQSIDCP
jgi:hypothetical protein